MIRLSVLQFRAQAATAAAALAVFAVILAATGPHLFGLYDSSGIAACPAHGNCLPLATSFVNKLDGFYAVFYFISIGILLLVPAVIGTFWAAPLSPASSRPAPSSSPGPRGSRAPTGWPPSSAWARWPPWPPPACSACC